MYSPAFRAWVRDITGCGPLSQLKVDASSARYTQGCVLRRGTVGLEGGLSALTFVSHRAPPPSSQLPPAPARRRHLDPAHLVDHVPADVALVARGRRRARALPRAPGAPSDRRIRIWRRASCVARELARRGRVRRLPDQEHPAQMGPVRLLRGRAGRELPRRPGGRRRPAQGEAVDLGLVSQADGGRGRVRGPRAGGARVVARADRSSPLAS